ncbi:SseB family protein [Streptosporangium saharense]|uniref:SseB family protein n=1 Tax=Streptosporangium saharense TaxID=1706840 RepID=UPI0034152556
MDQQDREAFASTRFYCQATESPGTLALGDPGAGVVPVFTSLDGLTAYVTARGEVEDARWFSTLGADLLTLLPTGYGLLIDPGTGHATVLTPRDRGLSRSAPRASEER